VGSVKQGETLQEAAARECLEETGYQVEVGPQVGVVETEENGAIQHFTFFLAKVIAESETYETDRQRKWVPLPELVDQVAAVFAPVTRAVIETRFS
jgi:ADP-ribose pyrophosphatase YjhB (NUDIX family)